MSIIRRIQSAIPANRASFLLAFIFPFLLFSTFSATAQVEKGVVTGHVTDTTGALIGKAQIYIRNEATNVTIQTISNEQGLYVSQPLDPGFYEVRVSANGFESVAKRVRLEVSQRLSADLTLTVGQSNVIVQVNAATIQFDTDTSTVSSLRTEEAVHNLPLNGRNFAELLGLGAGVVPGQSQMSTSVPYTQQRGPSTYVMNGQRLVDNRFLLDGIGDNENHNGLGVIIFPPIDAIEEFREETTDADARYGRAAGGIINVVFKSGSGHYHGEVFDFFRNSVLDAKNYFDLSSAKIPGFRLNNFGATFGGPLFRSANPRTFFFVDYAGQRLSQGLTYIDTVPDWGPGGIGDFSNYSTQVYDPVVYSNGSAAKSYFTGNIVPSSYWDSTGHKILQLYSEYASPNRPGYTTANNFIYTPQRIDNGNAFDVKIDHAFNDKDNAFLRYSQAYDSIVMPGNLPSPLVGANVCGPATQPAYQLVLSETHIFSPTLINTARAGWSRTFTDSKNFDGGQNLPTQLGINGVYQANDPAHSDGLPVFSIAGINSLGDAANSPTQIGTNNYQENDNINYVYGKHSIDAGVEVVRLQYDMYQSLAEHGTFSFLNSDYSGLALADLLVGAPASGSYAYVPGTRGFRQLDLSFYAQDSYKPTSKLTINYGIRYDNYLGWPWTEVENRMYQYAPWLSTTQLYQVGTNGISTSGVSGNNLNFAPRVGFSYKLFSKTTLHSGFGLYYEAPDISNSYGLSNNAPGINYWAFVNTHYSYDNAGFSNISNGLVHTYSPPSTPKGSPVVAIDPNAKTPYSEQWHLSVQQQFGSSSRLTAAYVGNTGRHLDVLANINQATVGENTSATTRPNSYFSTISQVQTNLFSSYNGLQTTWETRGKDLSAQVSFTYSHTLDENSAPNGMGTLTNAYNPHLDYGNSDQNIPKRLVGSLDYSIPFTASGYLKPWVEGWKVNSIFSFSDGIPFSVTSSSSALNSLDTATTYAYLLSGNGNGSLPSGKRSIHQWYNTSAFTTPSAAIASGNSNVSVWGNARRNSLQGPGTKQIDLSVSKTIWLAATRSLELRSEFFNLLNTPQFNNPATSTGKATAGTISSAGSPVTLQRTSREVQLAAKLSF